MIINSKNNKFIKSLKREKAKNRFLLFLDTPNLVKEAISSNQRLKHILVKEGKEFDFLNELKDKIISVNDDVLNYLSEVVTNAGIIGVFELSVKQHTQTEGNYLVLDGLQDAGNIGTLIRSAVGAGFNTVYLLDCVALNNIKLIRSSAGAFFKAELIELTREDFVSNFNKNNLYVADMNGENIFDSALKRPVGLVLGNEGKGVSQSIKNIAKGIISIPMLNKLESLNVAVSGSIIMYQLNFGGKNVRTQ